MKSRMFVGWRSEHSRTGKLWIRSVGNYFNKKEGDIRTGTTVTV